MTSNSPKDALSYLGAYEDFRNLLNPLQFKERAHSIFQGNSDGEKLLKEKFFDFQSEYGVIGPTASKCPKNLQKEVETILGRSLEVSLPAFIAIPYALRKATSPTKVRIAVRFHGGGGVSTAHDTISHDSANEDR
jgi:hypothetical protein